MPALKSTRHELFAQAIAKGASYPAACRAAGLKPSSANGARVKKRPEVRGRIAEIVDKAAAKNDVSVDRIFWKLACIAFADIRNVVSWVNIPVKEERRRKGGTVVVRESTQTDLRVRNSDELEAATAMAIAEVSKSVHGIVRVKLRDPQAALTTLCKLLSLFRDHKREDDEAEKGTPVQVNLVHYADALARPPE